jgi:hypothetical protein
MNTEQKLKDALQHIDALTDLIKGNEYEQILYHYLISVQVELKRQLTNIQYQSKIKE